MSMSSITEHWHGCQLHAPVACACGARIILILGLLTAPAEISAQEVFLDATPLIGVSTPLPPTGPAAPTTVTVPPGTVVPFELGVFVQPDPASPTANGLASFDVDIFTMLGVAQPPMTAFDPLILQTFTISPSLGFPSAGNILNVAAARNLAGFAHTGVVLAVSACLAGLIALRWHFDR